MGDLSEKGGRKGRGVSRSDIKGGLLKAAE